MCKYSVETVNLQIFATFVIYYNLINCKMRKSLEIIMKLLYTCDILIKKVYSN